MHAGSGLTFRGQAMAAPRLFKAQEFNFESLGIGGLDQQFDQIFRRAFASRVFPPAMVERLGIHHVKGVLLFGPPGTGVHKHLGGPLPERQAACCHRLQQQSGRALEVSESVRVASFWLP